MCMILRPSLPRKLEWPRTHRDPQPPDCQHLFRLAAPAFLFNQDSQAHPRVLCKSSFLRPITVLKRITMDNVGVRMRFFLRLGYCRCDCAFNPFLPALGKAAAPLSPALQASVSWAPPLPDRH